MSHIEANGIKIEDDAFGEKSSPPILLINGLGNQLIDWDNELCENLAAKGLYVIIFDNRDTGFSTKFEDAGVPNIMEVITANLQGTAFKAPYTFDDLADDAAGLLEALGIEKAHICGMSMGGMIAQTIAIRHPQRVLSLTSIYSTTGNPELPPPGPKIMQILMTPPPEERKASIEFKVNLFRALAGKGFAFDEAWVQEQAARISELLISKKGFARFPR